MLAVASHPVEGHVSRGFEAVREAFAENFARRGELGGACCAYHRGEKVVDLWGGIRNKQTGEPWEQDTMVRRPLGHEGPGRHDPGHRPLPRLARLRRAGRHVLARVRAAGQGEDHRPPAARPPGGAVRLRRTRRSQRGRRPRSPRGRAGPSEAGVGARNASGLSRASPSGSTKASCCAASIRGIAASDSSSRTRSPRRSERTSTSACRRRSRTLAWPRLSPPEPAPHADSDSRFDSRWKR